MYVSIRKDYVYQCIYPPWMQSSSVRVAYWKREFFYLPFHKEVSQSRQGQDQVFRVTKKPKDFRGICEAAGGKAATPPIPDFCFQRNSGFLYSLLKSTANAVLKLMSAVIAIAHVLFVSMKSLSINSMLLEHSFGKLKYDSTTLRMPGFLGSWPISASRSPVSLAILNFFLDFFSVGKSYPHSPDKTIHRRPRRSNTG